jgi:hypothetical protein
MTQAAIDSAAVIPLALLATWSGLTPGGAILMAAAYALHPLWAAGSTFLIADALSPALVVLTLAATVAASRSASAVAWVAPGMLVGLASLVRPDLLLMIGPIALWCVWVAPRPQRLRSAAVLVVTFALTMLPWGLHNRITHGVWLFTSASSGSGLWQGLGTLPNEHGYVVGDSAAAQRARAAGFEFGTIAGDRYLRQEYLKAAAAHPGHVARVIVARWKQILFSSERLQPLFFGRVRQVLDAVGIVLVVLAAVIVRRNRVALLLLALPPLYALFSVGIVYVEPRYVRYVHLAYVFGGVVVLMEAWQRLRLRQPRVAAAAAVLLVALGVLYAGRELAHLATLSSASQT